MLQPMLGFLIGRNGLPGEHRIQCRPHVFAGHGDPVAWPAVVQLAAIDQALVLVEQVKVRRASRPVRFGHRLGLVIEIREDVPADAASSAIFAGLSAG